MPLILLLLLLASCAAVDTNTTSPLLEVVVARYEEDLEWIEEVDSCWNITVYNKGGPVDSLQRLPKWRHYALSEIENTPGGQEGETYLHHILTRYDSLAQLTVFTQGDPFVHAPHFLTLLKEPERLLEVQALSTRYMENDRPALLSEEDLFRPERMSLYTLASQYIYDFGTVFFYSSYMKANDLEGGTNMMQHFYEAIGLPDWLPPHAEAGSFAFGAIFAATSDRIRQHGLAVYEAMRARCAEPGMAWVIERSWLMLLDPGFAGPPGVDLQLKEFGELISGPACPKTTSFWAMEVHASAVKRMREFKAHRTD